MHYRQAGYNQKSPHAGRLYGRLVALHAAEAAFQTPHEDENLGRDTQKEGSVGCTGNSRAARKIKVSRLSS